MMTRERFEELMEGESDYGQFKDVCRITYGAGIIGRYLPRFGIEAAEHDIVYSVDVDKIVEAGISAEDTETLRILGWFIDEETDSLAHFA